MAKKYNPLGSTFYEGMTMLLVSEANGCSCDGCWYNIKHHQIANYNSACYVHGHVCTSHTRKDKKQVIFKEIKIV